MQGIVCIAGTNRPENYTVRALGIVVDAFRQSRVGSLLSSMPGRCRWRSRAIQTQGMGSGSARRLPQHPASFSPRQNTTAAFVP